MKSPNQDQERLNRLKYEFSQEMGLKGQTDYVNKSEKNYKSDENTSSI